MVRRSSTGTKTYNKEKRQWKSSSSIKWMSAKQLNGAEEGKVFLSNGEYKPKKYHFGRFYRSESNSIETVPAETVYQTESVGYKMPSLFGIIVSVVLIVSFVNILTSFESDKSVYDECYSLLDVIASFGEDFKTNVLDTVELKEIDYTMSETSNNPIHNSFYNWYKNTGLYKFFDALGTAYCFMFQFIISIIRFIFNVFKVLF